MLDSSRVKGEWDEVKNIRESYMEVLKSGKLFKSIYSTANEQRAYAETVWMFIKVVYL